LEPQSEPRHGIDGKLVDPSEGPSFNIVFEVALATHRFEVNRLATTSGIRGGANSDNVGAV
jgi:hypothetical protein